MNDNSLVSLDSTTMSCSSLPGSSTASYSTDSNTENVEWSRKSPLLTAANRNFPVKQRSDRRFLGKLRKESAERMKLSREKCGSEAEIGTSTTNSNKSTSWNVPRCKLCIMGWKTPTLYSIQVSHIMHRLATHIDSVEMISEARHVAEVIGLSTNFPYLDFDSSLLATNAAGSKRFQCALCEKSFTSTSMFIRHSRRNHLTPVNKYNMGTGPSLNLSTDSNNENQESSRQYHLLAAANRRSRAKLRSDPLIMSKIREGTAERMSRWREKQASKAQDTSGDKSTNWDVPKCELCIQGWKTPVFYSIKISHIMHRLARHIDSDEAISEARLVTEEIDLSAEFPYLDFERSLLATKAAGSKTFQCALCDKSYSDASTFVRHSRRNHLAPVTKYNMGVGQSMECPFGCLGVGRVIREGFTFVDMLAAHFIAHHSDQSSAELRARLTPFLTPDTEECALRIKRSFKQKRFVCGQCDKFSSKSLHNFSWHFRQHTHPYEFETEMERRERKRQEASKEQAKAEHTKNAGDVNRPKDLLSALTLAEETKPPSPRKVRNRPPVEAPDPETGVGCKLCPFKGGTSKDLRLHSYRAHPELIPQIGDGATPLRRLKKSTCAVCGFHFRNRLSLKAHVKKKHKEGEECYQCWYCMKAFSRLNRVREHERRQHEISSLIDSQDLKCRICNMLFLTKHNLDEHLRRHRNPNSSFY